jgi:single-strand DNA-binding protein
MASRSWNRVELIGNLTRDPEMRYTPSGAAVVTFSIATNRTFISDGEKKEEADFHRCVAWNKLAELCNQLLKKGNRVFVSGRLQNRSWEDAQTKQTRYITEIVIEDMILLTNKDTFPSGEGKDTFSGGEYTPSEASSSVSARNADEMPETSIKEEKSEEAKSAKTEEKAPTRPSDGGKMEKEEVEDLDDLPF